MSVLANSLETDNSDIPKWRSTRAQFNVMALDMVRSKFHNPDFGYPQLIVNPVGMTVRL